jgi:hypothetical protein
LRLSENETYSRRSLWGGLLQGPSSFCAAPEFRHFAFRSIVVRIAAILDLSVAFGRR